MNNEKKYWLAFNAFFQIGPRKFNLLVKFFGSAEKAWKAPDSKIKEIDLGKTTTEKFLHFRKNFNIEKYLTFLEKLGIIALTLNDKDYPKLLKEIQDPPFVLYVQSQIPLKRLFAPPCLAVVGTRNISTYGKVITQKIVEGLVSYGITIVSGLARGVDVFAHKTALEAGGLTLAVLGSGIDCPYPAQNLPVAKEIIKKGALISEFPLGMKAYPGNFPVRNRIISGLSLGVVITEAAEKSGSLITASYAADQGREVFAVPGPITSPLSFGTSALIKKGAKLVTSVSDILEELPLKKTAAKRSFEDINLTGEEEKILKILENGPLVLDELVRISKQPAGKILSLVSMMELKGILKKSGDLVYSNLYE